LKVVGLCIDRWFGLKMMKRVRVDQGVKDPVGEVNPRGLSRVGKTKYTVKKGDESTSFEMKGQVSRRSVRSKSEISQLRIHFRISLDSASTVDSRASSRTRPAFKRRSDSGLAELRTGGREAKTPN